MTVKINLDNDAMQTSANVYNTLRKIAEQVEDCLLMHTSVSFPRKEFTENIPVFDPNGNNIGFWKISK